MIRHTKKTRREKLNELLLVVALLLSPALLRFISPAVLHAQSNGTTNELDFTDTADIPAGAPGQTVTIYGNFPINNGVQTPVCFYTVPGTSGKPLLPSKQGDGTSPEFVQLQVPAGSIQEIAASAFTDGVFYASAYATANASDTCDGKFDSSYTNTLSIPIQQPAVLSTDLDTLTARNTALGGNPAPREIYLQGTDFVPGEATVTFSGSSFETFPGVVTVVSSTAARVDVPPNLPAGAKSVDLKFCTHTASEDYCASPVTYPIQQLADNPGTLTATPNPSTPTTPTSLQAVFGSTDGYGVPSGAVTFAEAANTLGVAPLVFTSGQFVATHQPAAAPVGFEGRPKSIVVDLNHDGLQDVILYSSGTIQLYYAADNLGGFGFTGGQFGFSGVEFALDSDFCRNVVSVTTGDFNGDGYPDIAMLCTDPASDGATENVLVYLNQKDGTFAFESAEFPAPSASLITAADFDKDGKIDILLVGPDGNTDPNGTPLTGFTTYLGNGAGRFDSGAPIDIPFADGVQVAAVDFNNDGFPDIALLYHDFRSDLSTSQIEVFQNDGQGHFPTTPTYQQALGDKGATTHFFTPTLPKSNYPNLVAINGGINASIAVVFNNQTPTIGFSDTIYTAPVPGLLTATMGDFNGDGFQDVATYDGSNLSVYNAGPTGQYNQPLDSFTIVLPDLGTLVGSSDANGDGYSDPIAFITPSDGPRLVQQYITSGTATATLPSLTFAAGPHDLTATTTGTPTLSPGTASTKLVSNGPALIPVSNAVLTTSPVSPTTYAPSNPITLIAEVDAAASPAPTGSVTFIDAQTSQALGTVTLTPTSGTQSGASLTIATRPAGSYSFSARYSGDTTYLPANLPSATFIINKAMPVVSFVPNPATITYGTALSAAQLDATAILGGNTVAGSFVYTNASGTVVDTTTVLPAGSNSITATFTPADTMDYKTPAGVTSTITVNKATPVVTFAPNPATLASGTPLTAAQLDATATFGGNAVPGSFVYTNASGTAVTVGTVLPAGANVITASFTPSNQSNFNSPAGVAATITVSAATTTLTFVPNPATITFGTALSAAQLDATATSGGNPVAGTFVYTNASGSVVNTTTVLPAGINAITVNFTPSDTTSFTTPAAVTSTVTVNKATPTVSWTAPAAIPYGTALSGTQLNATASFNGTPVAGTFSYNPAAGTVLTAGTHPLAVTFTPTDTANFNIATGSTSITVGQDTPTITWTAPAQIAYGTALSATQLDATATFNGTAVAGTFSYNPAAGTVLTAGTHSLAVTFTPTDTNDFTVATGSTSITVGQSTPTITWATPAAIPYGTALSATQLNATATFNGTPVAGTFSYNPASGTILTAGSHTLNVTFTPTDATDFTVASGSTSITVGQSTPTITWATPAAIPYGTPLSATQLNATATFNGTPVAGTFSYNPASGTILTAGSHTLNVTFTPTDATDFAAATGTTNIAVGQSTPVITWTSPAAITLGTPLSAVQLNASATGVGGAALPGTFTYLPAAGAVLPVGASSLGITFTPTDAVDYKTATASVPLTVNPAATTTTVTSSANPAQFGQLLTFTVGVTSTYTGAAITGPVSVFDGQTLLGTVQLPNVTVSTSALSAGTHNITAVYGSNANFAGSSSTILTQTISSATTVINWPQPASVPYGAKLSATQLNATVSTAFAQTVPGTFTYTPAAGTLLTAGSQTLSVLFTPTDTTNFKTATATVTLVVTKVAPTLSWLTPANITAGTPLGATQLNATATDIAGNPLPGVFTYTPASGTILGPGPATLSASFAPTDTVDYTTAGINVPLNVDPAVTTLAVTSTANPSQFGQPVTFNVSMTSAYTATPIGGTVTISDGKTVLGTPTLTNGAASFSTSTLAAGAHNITASFAGNSTFAPATSAVLSQTVNLATTTITWPTPAGITYGTLLSATQLNATVATAYATTVPGTFVYTPAAGTLLTAGTQTLSVAFTPTDTVNFKPATGTVTIAVGKIAPTITWPAPADVVAGTTLSATQLNATASGIAGALPGTFSYTPALGTVLTTGTQTLSVTFTPTDLVDYTTATATVSVNVIGLALSNLSTTTVKLGDPALNLTLTGTGFLPNSVVYVGATPITPTFVNPTTLTAIIPASNFLTAQTLQITVNDPTQAQTSNALAIVVGAPPATISVNGPPTVAPGAQPNLTFTVTPYAVPITATMTLTFTPAPGLTTDGTILFPNGTTTTTFTIPASTTTIPPVQFQSGSVAGTITITLHLTAGGVDVTPTPAPTLVITSPAATPGVNAVTLDRSGQTLTVTIQGYSNTRDVEQIHFHFIAAPGQSLATSDLLIDGTSLFNAWYTNPASPTYGSTFHYIQVFNLDQDATVVGQVQVTLVNSQGNSQTVSAQ